MIPLQRAFIRLPVFVLEVLLVCLFGAVVFVFVLFLGMVVLGDGCFGFYIHHY